MEKIRPYYLELLFLTLLSIYIGFFATHWFPSLALAQKRILLVIALFTLWFLKLVFINDILSPLSAKYPISKEGLAKLQQLTSRFHDAMRFLKKTTIVKSGQTIKLARLPWFLLLGPHNSGKTAFLSHANINYTLSKQTKTHTITTSQICDWWATREVVLLDVPGAYLSQQPQLNTIWRYLITLIKKWQGQRGPISGVLLFLNLPELMLNEVELAEHKIKQLQTSLQDLRKAFGRNLPVHLIITKCDLLPGFTQFFGDITTDELAQAWGITLPAPHQQVNMIEVFNQRFNVLINRLNKQLLWRLHHERHSVSRSYIKDFPLYVEQLKERISKFLLALNLTQQGIYLHGVHLTSAVQQPPEAAQDTTLIQANTQALHYTTQPLNKPKVYFIKQILLHGLSPTTETSNRSTLKKFATYFISALAGIVIAALITKQGFFISRPIEEKIAINTPLQQLAHFSLAHWENSLTLLDQLQAQQQATVTNNNHWSWFTSTPQDHIAGTSYQQALQTIIYPSIKAFLEKKLQNSTNNPEVLYETLQAYLMLGDKSSLKSEVIINLLKNRLPSKNLADLEHFAQHLNQALLISNSISLNPRIISNTRKILIHLPPVELAYLILQKRNLHQDSIINLGTNVDTPSAFTNHSIANHIPALFTGQALQSVLSGDLAIAANEALHGNDVLGKISANTITLHNLTETLRNRYLDNYVDLWESQLENIKLNPTNNLGELDDLLTLLINDHSPLIQFLQTVQQNTNSPPILQRSPKLQALNGLYLNANAANSQLYQIFMALRSLHNDLATILSNNQDIAILQATSQYMTSNNDSISALYAIATVSPEPIQSWLEELAKQTWHGLLQDASKTIENAWQTNVIASYNNRLANRYPFTENAKEEATLENFSNFYGQQGTLIQFYTNYLAPFIDTTAKSWHWRKRHGSNINLSSTILPNFQHLIQLQHVLFPNGDNKLFIAFSLQPIALSTNIKKFLLKINNQQIEFNQEQPFATETLSWPGPNNTHETVVTFINSQNQPITQRFVGDWSFIRLINQLENNKQEQQRLLTFSFDNYHATYKISFRTSVNPLSLAYLQTLRIPQHLSSQS